MSGRMAKIAIIASRGSLWVDTLFRALCGLERNEYYLVDPQQFCDQAALDGTSPRCLYIPALAGREGIIPDLAEAETVFERLAQLKSGTLVLISSALIYGTGPGRQSFATEEYSAPGNGGKRICDQWSLLEKLARRSLNQNVRLTILRPVTVVPSPTLFSHLLLREFVPTLPGHDPTLQFLSLSDLASAVDCAAEKEKPGVFNVAPDGVTPLHAAVRMVGSHRIAVPRTLQRLTKASEVLDYLRYPWTVCNQKIKRELGFAPAKSSTTALLELRGHNRNGQKPEVQFDDFGMDNNYIHFYGKTLFRFLSDYYWRIEEKGLEHVPRAGRGVLVGMHRGFMPFDGVMALHLLVQKTGRYPRFLTHPALLRFPFLANFMTKLGGVVASQESADRLLEDDELLGIFPEGIRGAFTRYRQAYKLQEFGRDAFVKIALRNRAPIIPFVTVGSAEIFPIFGKIKSRLWTRYTEWPCVPFTPTFPLLPVPLPSKWHTQFLPPIHIEREHPPEAARNSAIVKAISLEVRTRMQQAVNEMLGRRRSIFFGSIFEPKAGQ
jgi:1-acyl-sn-glycerol-3-phosphate acyltransferase